MSFRCLNAILAAALFALTGCEREHRIFVDRDPGPEYQKNGYAMAQGKRLFTQYNCSGCHANGGGGMGPPLIDDKWIYGSEPEKIFETISKGRPNGMPAWGTRVPPDQIWQLVSYVRSMGGFVPKDAAPGRGDHLHPRQPEVQR